MSRENALKDYIQVNERIQAFYKKYKNGSIQTEIVQIDDSKVIFKAYAYRDENDLLPSTGYAMEKEGSSFINKGSHIENCETSAVGRALANLGLLVNKSVASYEEVANAKLNQEKEEKPKIANIKISAAQAKRLFALAKGDNDKVKEVLKKYGYESSMDIDKDKYNKICEELEG